MYKKLINLFFLLSLFLPTPSLAHTSGQTIEKQVDGYTFDVGYDSLDVNPMAGQSVRFDFRIYSGEKKDEVPFTNLWMKIAKGSDIVFAGRLVKEDLIPTGLLFTFPQGGDYEITTRFSQGDKKIAEAVFPLTVVSAVYETQTQQSKSGKWVVLGVSALLIGAIAYWFVFRKKN